MKWGGRMHEGREQLQLQWLRWVCEPRPLAWGQALRPLLGAVVGACVLLAWQMPGLNEEVQAAQQSLGQVRAQMDDLRGRLRQEQKAMDQGQWSVSAGVGFAETGNGPWHWQQLALAAGLSVDQLKPLEAAGVRPAQLQLRLRGRYHQHGAFVAALSEPAQAVRLLRYQMQAGVGDRHVAELLLELPASAGLPTAITGTPARLYQPAPGLDPFRELEPVDPLASVPVQWRAEVLRAKGLLETSPLSAFVLAGTLQRGGEWLALLQGERMLHTLRVGDRVGPDWGRVQHIAEQGLWLREIVRDRQGQWGEQERLWRVGDRP